MRFSLLLLCGLAACDDGSAGSDPIELPADARVMDAALDATLPDAMVDMAAPPVPECATSTLIFAFGEAEATIGDVTGDGQADRISVDQMMRVQIGDAASLQLTEGFLAVGRVDLDGDGQGDLALSMPWEDHFVVFKGPLAGELQLEDAMLHIKGRGQNGDISQLMGLAFAVGDLDGDRVVDVLLTAPAEQEEACSGTETPRFFKGPFAPGARLASADATFRLGGQVLGTCVGEDIECTPERLVMASAGEDWCYALPLTSEDAPVDCP
jgi:hypothetical protein